MFHQLGEGRVAQGLAVEVVLIVVATAQAEHHGAVGQHQFQLAVTKGSDKVLEDGAVVVGAAEQGVGIQAVIAVAQVAGQGADLVVALLPVIQQLLLFDICHGLQGVEGLYAQGFAGLLVDHEGHGQNRDQPDQQVTQGQLET